MVFNFKIKLDININKALSTLFNKINNKFLLKLEKNSNIISIKI